MNYDDMKDHLYDPNKMVSKDGGKTATTIRDLGDGWVFDPSVGFVWQGNGPSPIEKGLLFDATKKSWVPKPPELSPQVKFLRNRYQKSLARVKAETQAQANTTQEPETTPGEDVVRRLKAREIRDRLKE